MAQDQHTQPPTGHHQVDRAAAAPPRAQAMAETRGIGQCNSSNGGACTCDARRFHYDICSLLLQVDNSLAGYRQIVQRENPERPCILQQQHDSLNARWSACYEELQKEAYRKDGQLQTAQKDLEYTRAKLKEQESYNQAAEIASRELRTTLEIQGREVLRSRALHAQIEGLERDVAELKSVNQAVEEVLAMKKQRISDLEAALEKTEAGAEQLAANKAELESLKLQYSALEADHAEALELALFEGEPGSASAELIGQNRALEQQLRELRAENGFLTEQLEAAGGVCAGHTHGPLAGGGKEPEQDEKARAVTEGAGDEGKGRKRRRAK